MAKVPVHLLVVVLLICMVMAALTGISYSREDLLSLNPGKVPLPSDVHDTLLDLNISSVLPTRRGCRAGRDKQRPISPVTSVLNTEVTVSSKDAQTRHLENLVAIPPNNESKLRFSCLNVQSLRNKTAEFSDFVIENMLDVVAITETWLKPDGDEIFISELNPPGYTFQHIARGDRRGGGVGLLYKSSLTVKIKFDDDVSYSSFEYLRAEISSHSTTLYLVVVYRPELDSTGHRWNFGFFLSEFESMIDDYLLQPSDLIFTGDFNIHVNDLSDNEANRFKSLLSENGLFQHITEPTHRQGNCLDLLITRENSDTVSDIYLHPGLSWHHAIMCMVSLQKPKTPSVTITTRRLKSIDINAFRADVNSSLAKIDFATMDVESCVESYNSSLSCVLDKHAPSQTRTVRLRPNSPWFNESIRLEKQKRRQLERKWRRTKLDVDLQMYSEQKNTVNKLIEQAKIEYYSGQIDEKAGDQKQLFNVVNDLLHKSKEPVLPHCNSEEALAEQFSEFFSNKILNIRTNFPSKCTDSFSCETESNSTVYLTSFEPASESEVRDIICKSPCKSCELDPVPTSLVKECIDDFVPYITIIVNKSFAEGIFPDTLKTAYIRPLLKKTGSDKEVFKNYRPVANLGFLGKTIERVASVRISSIMNEHNLSDDFQSAYRPKHSIETALLRVENDILLNMDQGNLTALILLDLSAAFDTVDHSILLGRLRDCIGLHGSALEWCQSYLTNRPEYVRVGNASSSPVFHDYAVPQGSVLGPQWFTIYTYPIHNIILKYGLMYHIYADDTQLYICFNPTQSSADHVIEQIEACICEIRQWMQDNFLKLNDEKTEFLLIGSRHQLSKVSVPHITIGDSDITPASNARNLGVIFDSSMSLNAHISNIVRCASFQLRNISRVRKYLSPHATEQIVHSFITSRLDMGNSLLFGLPQNQIARLQRIQNTAARLVTLTKKRSHITPVLKDLHWLPVGYRIVYKLMLFVYKALHNMTPDYITHLLQPYNSCYSTL